MAQDKPNYKILASTIEDFQKIEDAISKLPAEVLIQIEKAEYGVCGIHCTFRKQFPNESVKIALPENSTQITDFGDDIHCYAGNYHFIIPKYSENIKMTYYFTNRGQSKKEVLLKELREELKILIENKSSQNSIDSIKSMIDRIEKI